jgi:uncharacterized protein (DUF488 family)
MLMIEPPPLAYMADVCVGVSLARCCALLYIRDDAGVRTLDVTELLTVGYQGRTAAELIGLLEQARVDVVVDVRLTPLSRKPGLSKRALAERLAQAGIDYVHLRGLGNPVENRDGFRRGEQDSKHRFGKVLTSDDGQRALGEIRELMHEQRVALLCFEQDAATCHRDLVSAALRSPESSVAVRNL